MLKSQQNQEVCIYVLDIMMDLLFLDQELIEDSYGEIERIITSQASKLVIYNMHEEQLKTVTGNLETLCCAILNLRIDPMQYNKKKDIEPLSDTVLSAHLNLVCKNKKKSQVAHIVDQLIFVENMIKLPKFLLNEN